jgi:hypothetical protein
MSKSSASKKSLTNWKRLEAMKDKDVDASDIPLPAPEIDVKAIVKRALDSKLSDAQLTERADAKENANSKKLSDEEANRKFDAMLERMQELNANFSDEEIEADVEAAIQEVRAERRAKRKMDGRKT